jgi:hypothetical protein
MREEIQMKNIKIAMIALLLLATILRASNFVSGQATTNIFVDPSKYVATTPHETFTVDINISEAVGVNAWELYVHFDPTIIVASGYQSGGFLASVGTPFPLNVVNQSSLGYIQAGENLMAPGGADGNGTLLKLTFSSVGSGNCPIQLYNTKLYDTDLNELNHTTTDGAFVGLSNFGVDVNGDGSTDTYVNIDTNSSILTGFRYNITDKRIHFTVGGDNGTIGYANVTIPKTVLNATVPGDWHVRYDGAYVTTFTLMSNDTANFVYLTYSQSVHDLEILVLYPKIVLNPSSGIAAFIIDGSDFALNSTITIMWNQTTLKTVPSNVTSDPEGYFQAIAVVPTQGEAGNYSVTASDALGRTAEATFTVLNMTGPQGIPGVNGTEGPQGIAGVNGTDGNPGEAGAPAPMEYTWASLILSIIAIIAVVIFIFRKKP